MIGATNTKTVNPILGVTPSGPSAMAIVRKNDMAIEKKPDYHQALNARGLIRLNKGENEDALKDFEKALEIRPDFFWAIINKGLVIERSGKIEEAIKLYDRAIQIAPNNLIINVDDTPNTCGVRIMTSETIPAPAKTTVIGRSWSVRIFVATWALERSLSSCKPIFNELNIVGMDLTTVMIPAQATAPAPI